MILSSWGPSGEVVVGPIYVQFPCDGDSTGHNNPVPLVKESRGSCPGGRSCTFIH